MSYISSRLTLPPGTPPEVRELVEQLQREFDLISKTFTGLPLLQIQERGIEPARPRPGMIAYADGGNWNPGEGESFYGYKEDEWVNLAGGVRQVVTATYSGATSSTTAMPSDDTIPQNTEGEETITATITPKKTTNKLVIEFSGWTFKDTSGTAVFALFQDSTADALAVTIASFDAAFAVPVILKHIMDAGTTSATTFKIRYGSPTGAAVRVNSNNTGRLFGGISAIRLTITEIEP